MADQSKIWQESFQLQGTQLMMSFSNHSQINGQTKVFNRCLEPYLQCFCSDRPNHWVTWLPLADGYSSIGPQNGAIWSYLWTASSYTYIISFGQHPGGTSWAQSTCSWCYLTSSQGQSYHGSESNEAASRSTLIMAQWNWCLTSMVHLRWLNERDQ